ncbi:magnesium/cobalt transporter CorA [Thioalbus denitrificans]|uniref:Magnesium transport protein CorA n=1 Tax=Thioalbus denitrificans TaxID=547122 RepID=A0A369C9D1_9GAMM|nr:magnesium/cobalt transporter CorA [Thioalbus denitrificans]RCX30640.1 magnesium transporter [Thioalbus denitrificans]
MSYFTKRYHPPGTLPGTLRPAIAEAPLVFTLVDYDAADITEILDARPEDCRPFMDRDSVTWIHIQGHAAPEVLGELGEMFRLHPLALEDVHNTGQRPKAELYDNQLFMILSRPRGAGAQDVGGQVSLFLGQGYVVSFNDGPDDPFEPIRARLHANQGRIRRRGADYLLYSLVDLVIDEGFPVLETLGLRIEELEEEVLETPTRETLGRIQALKRELLLLRRMVWPHREVVNMMVREDCTLLEEGTRVYLRDCYDHSIQIMDLLESYRDMTASMLDIYLSSASFRLNDVMRVLTIIATLFIPLTFIVGVYGMNFDRNAGPWSMPELGWPYGYLLVWVLMIAIAGGMFVYFRRKGWL